MAGTKIGVIFTLLIIGVVSSDTYNNNFCANSTTTEFIANPTLCGAWVACSGGKVVNGGNCPPGHIFGNDECEKSEICPTGRLVDICKSKNNGHAVPDPYSCRGYYYCLNNAGYPGLCDSEYMFDEVSQECKNRPGEKCPDDGSSAGKGGKECENIPPNMRVRSETSCYDFYLCDGTGKGVKGTCSPYFYSPNTDTCELANPDICSIPGGTTTTTTAAPVITTPSYGTTVASEDSRCASGKEFVETSKFCSAYHYCKNNKVEWSGFCRDGLVFDEQSQKCITTSKPCDKNRCDGKEVNYFAKDVKCCRNYLHCKGQGTVSEPTPCKEGHIFDENNQQCVKGSIDDCPSNEKCVIMM